MEKLAMLRPVRLRLKKPLEGPYTRLIRRPIPEVQALGEGQTVAIVRAARIKEVVPLYPSLAACYYPKKKKSNGLCAEDFSDVVRAQFILDEWAEDGEITLSYLAVPVGYIRLPSARWVSALTARITPWNEAPVELWRQHISRDIWLNIVRIYRFEPLAIAVIPKNEVQTQASPMRLDKLEPVLSDAEFAEKLDQLLCEVDGKQEDRKDILGAASLKMHGQGRINERQELASTYTARDFYEDSGFDEDEIMGWKQQLARKQQLIFYGPPGTGKTFIAQCLARCMLSQTSGFSEIVQFHPSYSYEDFVQGIRPQATGGAIEFELAEGRFISFCKRAEKVSGPCILIIDEINRANLSRVFGELMYLLEYRESEVSLSGGGAPFKIPQNVYLIGTMNTADRSIALVDQALRRRFTFARIEPNYSALKRQLEKYNYPATELVEVLKEINHSIGDANHELGISFFLGDDDQLPMVLPTIWVGEIEPYLEEVFYDRPERMKDFRWEILKQGKLKKWD